MRKPQDESNLSLSKLGSLQIEKNASVVAENSATSPAALMKNTNVFNFVATNNAKTSQIQANFQIEKKIVVLTFFLLVVGIGLYCAGFVIFAFSGKSKNGIVFWVIGTLVLIPGGYYFWKILLIIRMKNRRNKVEIIKEMNEQFH